MADWESGEVVLQEDETDQYAWVSPDEAKKYDLIGGIDHELQMVEERRNGKNKVEWRGK